jgi:ABC-type transport system substrate-binding protein
VKVNKKLLLGLLIIAAFSTFFWSTSSNVVAETTGLSQAKDDQFWIENQGYVDQIIYKVITQDELLVEATRTGEIDIVGQFVDVALLKPSDFSNPNLGLTQTRRRGFGHVTFNNQEFPTSVRALRQGFAYALDKVDLQQRVLLGASFTADSPIVGSLGVWSCEYEYTLSPCSPNGETYYDPQVGLGNETVLNAGFYDYDGDGFREFFNGNVTHSPEGLIWSGSSVKQGNAVSTTSGYPDPNWNGYTYKGADGVRRTFPQVVKLMGGGDLGPNSQGALAGMPSSWEEVEFIVTGSAVVIS